MSLKDQYGGIPDDFDDDRPDGGPPGILTAEGQTDLSNARRLVWMFGERIRYCHPWKRWMVWDGCRWAPDTDGSIERMGKAVADSLWVRAGELNDSGVKRWAVKTSEARSIKSMIALAQSEVPIATSEMDANPWLLNCLNGTVDLRTGELREHRREDCITKVCPVEFNPSATAPTWEQFQRDVCNGDDELIGFKRRLFGYSCTGDTREQILAIAWGSGSNGKSTEIDALAATLGKDYCGTIPRSLLMVKRFQEHPTELTTLFGKRLMFGHETDSGGRLSEALVKQLTGSDAIKARGMHQDYFEFSPSHKIVLATNHQPEVRGTDHAIWRRLKMIPYTVRFDGERRDRSMPQRLAQETQGILAWLVRGCSEWQQEGLGEPEAVSSATQEYRVSQDVLATFIDECCVVGPNCTVKSTPLYKEYKQWAERAGEHRLSQKLFGRAVRERGFNDMRNNGIWYIGIGIRAEGTEGTEPHF